MLEGSLNFHEYSNTHIKQELKPNAINQKIQSTTAYDFLLNIEKRNQIKRNQVPKTSWDICLRLNPSQWAKKCCFHTQAFVCPKEDML